MGIVLHERGKLRLHQKIDPSVWIRRPQNTYKRRCKDDVAERTESDDENIIQIAHEIRQVGVARFLVGALDQQTFATLACAERSVWSISAND